MICRLVVITFAVLYAVALGLSDRGRFLVADWAKALNAEFDVVLANPPYIRTEEIDYLEPEVVFGDPRMALDGGLQHQVYSHQSILLRQEYISPSRESLHQP